MISGPQRKFCEGIVSGLNQTDAYTRAYPRSSKIASKDNASRLIAKDSIKAEIQRMRDKADRMKGSAVMTLAEKRSFLARVVRMKGGEEMPPENEDLVNGIRLKEQGIELLMPDKLRAIMIDNDLSGDGAEAQKNVAVAGLSELVNRLRK